MMYSNMLVKAALIVLTIALTPRAGARFAVGGLSFQDMFEKADLVVVATVVKTKDTPERKKLIDIDLVNSTAPEQLQNPVVGVETEFLVRLTFKGPKEVGRFLLHHYRWDFDETVANGPNFIRIPIDRHGTFLMFLRKEADGRYAPITGQFDPDGQSVFEIKDATPDKPVVGPLEHNSK